MSEKLPISLVLIASNEADRLPACIEPVKDIVSEIVAVINDCKDNTEEILTSYGAKIYHEPWQGNGPQKIIALSHATQPWVLSLDADEVVTPSLKREILEFFEKHAQNYAGAEFPRKSCFLGRWIKHGDWYPDRILRLFKREGARFTGGKDHEKVEVDGKVLKFKSDLLHYTYRSKFEMDEMILKMPRFGNAHVGWQSHKGMKFNIFRPALRAIWRFFRGYILKKGFLDGYPGLFIAMTQGYSCFYRYSKLYEAKVNGKRPPLEASDL